MVIVGRYIDKRSQKDSFNFQNGGWKVITTQASKQASEL